MIPEIIKSAIAVGCGSFIGGAGRYLISTAMRNVSTGFPWGTLVVNLVGCLMIGLLWGLSSRTSDENSLWPVFLTTGLCGGFTTFSTFSKEALALLQVNNYIGFAAYIGISMIGGIAAVAVGYVLTK